MPSFSYYDPQERDLNYYLGLLAQQPVTPWADWINKAKLPTSTNPNIPVLQPGVTVAPGTFELPENLRGQVESGVSSLAQVQPKAASFSPETTLADLQAEKARTQATLADAIKQFQSITPQQVTAPVISVPQASAADQAQLAAAKQLRANALQQMQNFAPAEVKPVLPAYQEGQMPKEATSDLGNAIQAIRVLLGLWGGIAGGPQALIQSLGGMADEQLKKSEAEKQRKFSFMEREADRRARFQEGVAQMQNQVALHNQQLMQSGQLARLASIIGMSEQDLRNALTEKEANVNRELSVNQANAGAKFQADSKNVEAVNTLRQQQTALPVQIAAKRADEATQQFSDWGKLMAQLAENKDLHAAQIKELLARGDYYKFLPALNSAKSVDIMDEPEVQAQAGQVKRLGMQGISTPRGGAGMPPIPAPDSQPVIYPLVPTAQMEPNKLYQHPNGHIVTKNPATGQVVVVQ